MKKTISVIMLISILSCIFITGCTPKENDGMNTVQVKLEDVHQKIKTAYGENYKLSKKYTKEEVSQKFGISSDSIKDVIAEGSDDDNDAFIAVQANEGKGEEVEKALKKHREDLINNEGEGDNKYRYESSSVERFDDYVFFIMLGNSPVDSAVQGGEDLFNALKEQTKIGIDTLKGIFNK